MRVCKVCPFSKQPNQNVVEDLRKTAPTALPCRTGYCQRRHVLLEQFCVSPKFLFGWMTSRKIPNISRAKDRAYFGAALIYLGVRKHLLLPLPLPLVG